MAIITTQTIPAALLKLYEAALGKARQWKSQYNVRERYPWRLPQMQGDGRVYPDGDLGSHVSLAQFFHRRHFRRSCDCYNMQDPTHAILNPDYGPKSRGYWFDQAIGSGFWYYDYFMQQTINAYIATGAPVYCRKLVTADAWVWRENPENNYGSDIELRTNNWNDWEMQIFVTKNDPTTNIYHFWVYHLQYVPYAEGKFITFDFYEVNETINEMGITWNNKPALGRRIATLDISFDDDETWQEVYLPDVKAFAILTRWSDYNPAAQWGMTIISREEDPAEETLPYWT